MTAQDALPPIRIPVRHLVESCLRSGDLVIDVWDSTHPVAAIRAHQQIQRSRPAEYAAEVPVTVTIEADGQPLELSGRIDGVFTYPDRVIIEEIKTTRRDLEDIGALENSRHWGQARIYTHLYRLIYGTDSIETHLTYFQLDSRKTATFVQTFSPAELESFFSELLDRFLHRYRFLESWRQCRDSTVRSAGFPFENYRIGQREMAVAAYRAARDGRQLMIQAPTGVGKTVATLFPAAKAMAEGAIERVLYLTARNTGKLTASSALEALRRKGMRFRHVELTAKEKICFNPERACNGEDCSYACGYYDRVDGAIGELLELDSLTREAIETASRTHSVCPFELSLEMTLLSDCILCDYNYAFDPRVSLRRILEDPGRLLFLVDEAHNLVDRARDMFSAELSKGAFLSLRRQVGRRLSKVARSLTRINSELLKLRRRADEQGGVQTEAEPPAALLPLLRKFVQTAEPWLSFRASRDLPFRDSLRELVFATNRFLRVAEQVDGTYSTIYSASRQELLVRLFCIDPAPQLAAAFERASSAVLFSATFSPMQYFKMVLGLEDSTEMAQLPSPFPSENLCLLIVNSIPTVYSRRKETAKEVAETIQAFLNSHPGNHLLFFPSYEYLSLIQEHLKSSLEGFDLLVQEPEMSEDERQAFLSYFGEDGKRNTVGMAVMGGVFGEAIDLSGERLTGAVIVTVGLPALCLERQLIRDYFEQKCGTGFEFAYTYPGMNRVLQAAGRVIRSEGDRGAVLLLDERFSRHQYRQLLPPHWQPKWVAETRRIPDLLAAFWAGQTENCASK